MTQIITELLQEDLNNALNKLRYSVEKESALPFYSCVRMDVTEGNVRLSAFNNTWYRFWTQIDVGARTANIDFTVFVPYEAFKTAVNILPAERLVMVYDTETETLDLRTDSRSNKVSCLVLGERDREEVPMGENR